MNITLSFVDKIEDRPALAAMLDAYGREMMPQLAAIGGPEIDPAHLSNVIDNPEELLPPRHRLLLAHAGERLIGCASLRRIRDDAAEMKRMYVAPDARGTGLGRRLFETRIEEARRMGLTWLYADTIKGNRAMLAMYEKFGFTYIDRYPENANPENFEPFLVYLSCKL